MCVFSALQFATFERLETDQNSFNSLSFSRSAPSTIPGSSSSEREESVSPNLSNSPLQSFTGMTSALPGSNGYGRDSYDSNVSAEEVEGAEPDLPVDTEEAFDGQEDENEALKKYKGE